MKQIFGELRLPLSTRMKSSFQPKNLQFLGDSSLEA
jgi:hypothetical protein